MNHINGLAAVRVKPPDFVQGEALPPGRLPSRELTSSLAELMQWTPHRILTAEPRRPLRDPGTDRDEVMFVRSGLLSKYIALPSGRRQIVALRFAGECILAGEGAAIYGIQPIARSEVLVAKAKDFAHTVETHPGVRHLLSRHMQRHEAIGYEWLVNCGLRDSTARVAHLLCETAVRSGATVPDRPLQNPFTQQQIADITGQTSVNVNRVFADLERQGLLERSGREILIKDWAELRRLAGFQPDYLG